MTDRELLELAAKAAGMDVIHWSTTLHGEPFATLRDTNLWRPLSNDGDALRLAVKLEIQSGYSSFTGNAYVRWDKGEKTDAVYGPCDPYAATRLAIVRAAAEIGKSLP